MALAHNEVQVTWGAGSENSGDVPHDGTQANTSNTANLADTAFQAQIELKADNTDTPASGDTVDFWLLQTLGDPDGTGSNEFETDEQGTFLATLDTNADDPAISVVELPIPSVGVQVKAKNQAAFNSTVSATILEQTG